MDLFGPFQEQGSEAVYFRGLDDHWNDHGQDVAAQVVTRFLEANDLLERLGGGQQVAGQGE